MKGDKILDPLSDCYILRGRQSTETVDWLVNLLHSANCKLEVVIKDVLVGLILKAVK
jgi:hypothetical protein